MLRRSIVLVAATIAPGCLEAPARACQVDDECSLAANGSCRAPGYCVYETSDCPSGLEFGPYAGEGLAGKCFVSGNDDDGGSSSGGTESGSDSDPSDDSGDATSGAPPPSLEIVELGIVSAPGPVNALHLAADGERIVVAGHSTDDEGFVVAVHALDASVVWAALDPAAVGPHRVAMVAAHDDETWVAGTRNPDADGWGLPFVARLDGDGTPVWTRSWNTLGDDALFGAGLDAAGNTTIAGRLDGRPWLLRLDSEGAEFGTQQWSIGASDVEPRVLASTPGGTVVLCGPNDTDAFGLRIVDGAGALIARSADLFSEPCAATFAGPSTILVAGLDPGSVGGFDYVGNQLWAGSSAVEPAAGIVADLAGRATTIAAGADGITVQRFDIGGASSVQTRLPGAFDRAAIARHGDAIVLATAAAGQNEIVLWSIEP